MTPGQQKVIQRMSSGQRLLLHVMRKGARVTTGKGDGYRTTRGTLEALAAVHAISRGADGEWMLSEWAK